MKTIQSAALHSNQSDGVNVLSDHRKQYTKMNWITFHNYAKLNISLWSFKWLRIKEERQNKTKQNKTKKKEQGNNKECDQKSISKIL